MVLKIPLQTVMLDGDGFHIFIKATLNSKEANLLVDTGASRTVFDLNRIGKFVRKSKKSFESYGGSTAGLGTNTMESHYTIIKKFGISELCIENFQAILLDMKHVNESYELLGLTAIDGVLGSDVLMEFKAVIDYDKEILKLKI
jgi:predicted aspartyl protease